MLPRSVASSCLCVVQVGGLIKRLDTGEGSYAKELEEDYEVAAELDQVLLQQASFWTFNHHAALIKHTSGPLHTLHDGSIGCWMWSIA